MIKEYIKNILFNSIIVFIICFIIIFILQLYQDYGYYSSYSSDELKEFFSMSDTLLFILKQSLYIGIRQLIVIIPAFIILEIIKIRNIIKIIIVFALTMVISVIFVFLNFNIVF